MIKTSNSPGARLIFNWYTDRLMKKYFSEFYAVNLPDAGPDDLLLMTPNHFSWWDGFLIDYAVRKILKRDTKMMMLEDQLKKHPFFSKVGAFSIRPGSPKDIIESFSYASQLIQDIRNCTVIFPQGEIQKYDKFPPDIKPGLNRFMTLMPEELKVIPAALKIVYDNRKLPYICLRFGKSLPGSSISKDYSDFTRAFNANISDLNEASFGNCFRTELFRGKV